MNGIVKFQDRQEAGRRLAEALFRERGRNPLVIGIPRGGVVIADVVARELDGDLDVALVRKLRAPGYAELAIGSVTEHGLVVMNEGMEDLANDSYLQTEIEEAKETLRQRRRAYTPHAAPVPPAGRLTIVVDDGVATGATMIAALRSLRESGAKRIIAAAAVAPPQAVGVLRAEADDVVVLQTPDPFVAVSLYFESFAEVADDDVIALLAGRRERREVPLHHGNFGLHSPKGPP